jgi:membrane-bound lytic murein transglycosylase D
VILADNSPALVLPPSNARIFLANLQERDEPLVSWKKYTFKRGDSLARIAARHGISLARLKQVNNIGRHTRVRTGYQLLLPLKGASIEPLPAIFRPPASQGRRLSYKIRRGDTLSGIARRFNVSTQDLRRWNKIGRTIFAGQHLVIEAR